MAWGVAWRAALGLFAGGLVMGALYGPLSVLLAAGIEALGIATVSHSNLDPMGLLTTVLLGGVFGLISGGALGLVIGGLAGIYTLNGLRKGREFRLYGRALRVIIVVLSAVVVLVVMLAIIGPTLALKGGAVQFFIFVFIPTVAAGIWSSWIAGRVVSWAREQTELQTRPKPNSRQQR